MHHSNIAKELQVRNVLIVCLKWLYGAITWGMSHGILDLWSLHLLRNNRLPGVTFNLSHPTWEHFSQFMLRVSYVSPFLSRLASHALLVDRHSEYIWNQLFIFFKRRCSVHVYTLVLTMNWDRKINSDNYYLWKSSSACSVFIFTIRSIVIYVKVDKHFMFRSHRRWFSAEDFRHD